MHFSIAKPVYGIALLSLLLLEACGGGGDPFTYKATLGNASVSAVPAIPAVPNLVAARAIHNATQISGGKVLVVGGSSGTTYLASAELYDPVANTWSAASSLSKARIYNTTTLLPSGKVLVAGGRDGSYVAVAELYDPDTNTWSTAGNLITPRYLHSATLLATGQVLVTGGYGASSSILGGDKILSSAELYDPASNTWLPAGSLATPRQSHTATLLQTGKVLVIGGYGPGGGLLGSSTPKLLASAEIYDPLPNSWAIAPSPAELRTFHTATLLPDGRVLVAGGFYEGAGVITVYKPHGSTELYDPVTNAWSAGGLLVTTRGRHTATLLPSGKVLVTGGFGDTGTIINGQNILESIELYDPSANKWSNAGILANSRENHTATLLPSGKVLITGGQDNSGVISSTELY
jgi:N-acetylneuraminic acid mutarotase